MLRNLEVDIYFGSTVSKWFGWRVFELFESSTILGSFATIKCIKSIYL